MPDGGMAFRGRLARLQFEPILLDPQVVDAGLDESLAITREARLRDVFIRPARGEAVLRQPERFWPDFGIRQPIPGLEEPLPIDIHDRLKLRIPVFPIPDVVFPVTPPPKVEGLRRSELSVPVAPSAVVTDEVVFTSPENDRAYALPRYALATDRIGALDEPRIVITDRAGVETLVLTLVETPGPASSDGIEELPHVVAVTLKLSLPVLEGGRIVQEHPFPVVLFNEAETILTAELPLSAPGLREQLVTALGSLEASVTLVVERGVKVAVPTGENIDDIEPAFREVLLLLEYVVPPTPLLLSAQQRARLGGGGGELQPVRRVRVDFNGRSHAYWQDPVHPERFSFLPDRFLLARSADPPHGPVLRVSAASAETEADISTVVEFSAVPIVDSDRLAAAIPALEREAQQRGATAPVVLERLHEAQPVLRLALPQGGAASSMLTDRPATEIDLERGIIHAERLNLDDFRLVYDALFGASLSLLRGEVRVAAASPSPEDIPLELRLDRTFGDVLVLQPHPIDDEGIITARLTNVIESPVLIGVLSASVVCEGALVPATISGLPGGEPRLDTGAGIELVITPERELPGPVLGLVLDQSRVVVEPDREAIWTLVFDRSAEGRLTRHVQVQAVAQMFISAELPDDRVLAFVITIEGGGGSASLTEDSLNASTTVRVPVKPLLTGKPLPPIRYRTETHWQSGGVGTSEWRETDATILFPVRTNPA